MKILLDTNAYLRLAEPFHPLLKVLIPGQQGGILSIIPDVVNELGRNPELRHKFAWVFSPEFIEDRKACRWRVPAQARTEIAATYKFILEYSANIGNGASPVDVRCLAYARVLGIRAVTDDGDMTELADSFDIPVLPTLGLLKLMLDAELCPMRKVRSIIRYWIAVADLPRNWRTDYQQLFGEEPPYESHVKMPDTLLQRHLADKL